MSLSPEHQPEITIPTPEDVGDMLRLRTRLYVDELITSGIPKDVAERHTKDWASPDSIEEYREIVEDWLVDPDVF